MKRKFAVFDIDGTLFRSSLYRELANELIDMGCISNDDLINEIRRTRQRWHARESTDAYDEYDRVVSTGVDNLLSTIPVNLYYEAVERTIQANRMRVYAYTRNLISQLKSEGYFLVAISGSPKELVEAFAKTYGFDIWIGQDWIRTPNGFTGEIIKTHTDKHLHLERLVEQHNLTLSDSVAVGDSAGDITMLAYVEKPIAFNPTDELIAESTTRHWPMVIERKNIAYTLKPDTKTGIYMLSSHDKI